MAENVVSEPPCELADTGLLSGFTVYDINPETLDALAILRFALDLHGDLAARARRKRNQRPVTPAARSDGADDGLAVDKLDAGLAPLGHVLIGDEEDEPTLIVKGGPVCVHRDACGVEFVEIYGGGEEDSRRIVHVGVGWLAPEIGLGRGADRERWEFMTVGRFAAGSSWDIAIADEPWCSLSFGRTDMMVRV